MKPVFLAATLVTCASTIACINDRDTLAFELRNVDAIKRVRQETDYDKQGDAAHEIALKAIGGRFERFPAKYYEMRIARLEAKAALTALEYDDLAVAYERLGKTEKAIEILLASKPLRRTKDDHYRFHANYGTFLVHKWLKQEKREDKETLNQSIIQIEKALEINPNSHFGREQVQLELERIWMTGGHPVHGRLGSVDRIDQLVGLSGIVMMGLAYELPDAYALMTWLRVGASSSLLDGFAISRAKELKAAGHGFVEKDLDKAENLEALSNEEVKRAYGELRADGERVHQARLAYLDKRLDRGEHPDTHPDFWKEWTEPPLPVLNRIPELYHAAAKAMPNILMYSGIGAAVLASGLFVWRRRVKRLRSAR